MAILTNIRDTVRPGSTGRIAAMFRSVELRMEQYRTYRRTLHELSILSERELCDLGIHRSMIRSIASEAAYGRP